MKTPRERRFVSDLRRSVFFRALFTLFLFPGLFNLGTLSYANPTGGIVVHGDVSFSGGAGSLTVNQASQNAIINWESFSIDAGELTQFVQPGTCH
ncbi:MAG: hypothetical protein AAF236_01810 [Verrucomicrobiota bacterium]